MDKNNKRGKKSRQMYLLFGFILLIRSCKKWRSSWCSWASADFSAGIRFLLVVKTSRTKNRHGSEVFIGIKVCTGILVFQRSVVPSCGAEWTAFIHVCGAWSRQVDSYLPAAIGDSTICLMSWWHMSCETFQQAMLEPTASPNPAWSVSRLTEVTLAAGSRQSGFHD